jgi:glucose/arabinose dehydrogenase
MIRGMVLVVTALLLSVLGASQVDANAAEDPAAASRPLPPGWADDPSEPPVQGAWHLQMGARGASHTRGRVPGRA